MTTNIDSCHTIGGHGLTITEEMAGHLLRGIGDDLPASLRDELAGLEFDASGRACITFALWGPFSGHCYRSYLATIAAALEGDADVVIVWEGGHLPVGLRIADGEAVEMDVRMSLVPRHSLASRPRRDAARGEGNRDAVT